MGMYQAGRLLIKQFVKRNTEYLKRTSSGRDLVFYCGDTPHQWNPELFKRKGFGGSEEAVLYVTRELAKLGWHVTVYNNCGHKPIVEAGVTYRPFWEFNPRDKQDVVVVWRASKPLDWNINAEKIFVELQDATDERPFTKRDRMARVTRVFVRSPFHRSLYPHLPDHKMAVIPNGIDFSLLDGDERKEPYLLINTSSADRSMSVLPKLFSEIKRRVPQARLQWAYGWELFEAVNARRPDRLEWMRRTRREMDEAGIETLGHLSQAEVGRLYQRGAIFAYPTTYLETDCISVKKAQACGCVPVTTDVGALATSVEFGIKVPCKPADPSNQAQRFHRGVEDPESQRMWVDATVDLLTNTQKRAEFATRGEKWARQFGWPQIAARWHDILSGQERFAPTP